MYRLIINTMALTTVVLIDSQANAQIKIVYDYPGATVSYSFDGANSTEPKISVNRTIGNMTMVTRLGGPTSATEIKIVVRKDHRTRVPPKKLDWLDRPEYALNIPTKYVPDGPILYQHVPFNHNKLPKSMELRAQAITELVALHYPQSVVR